MISDEDERDIIWKEETENAEANDDDEDDDYDRMYPFEVLKTNEQEEDVNARPGFSVGAGH